MARDVALLFAPPLRPVRVEAGLEVTLGRSPTCTLALPSPQASRHHASVRATGGQAVVMDLGSTNGTFVNGERLVGERVLLPGDRIQIGDTQVTFCRVETEEAAGLDPNGDATMLADPTFTQPPEVLEGDLRKIPFFAVLQMLEMGVQRGRLGLLTNGGAMALWLEGSRIVHAQTEKDTGLDAALRIAGATEGRFHFTPDSPPPERSLDVSVTEIILEASRLEDEGRSS